MVKVMKKIGFVYLVVMMAVFTQNASAVLTSSYYDGSVSYSTEDGLQGRIYFAVYDTQDAEHGNEYVANGLGKPGEGQYIYAYQIFSSSFFSIGSVAEFGILDAAGEEIDTSLMNGTTAQDDKQGGIAPSPLESVTQGVWQWVDGANIIPGDHSWLLVFSSDNSWVSGTYAIKAATDIPVPASVPEPATLLLLGLGGAGLFARRVRSRS
jgi:hypothetical protein